MKDYSDHICIIGAGPIGNHLSTELLDRGHKVLVIEAGNTHSESSLLNYGDYIFSTPSMLPKNVHRVGGGGNYWIGRVGEFQEKDFLAQAKIRNEKWPFSKKELLKFYRSVYLKLTNRDLLDDEFIFNYLEKSLDIPVGLGIRPIRYIDPHALRNLFLASLNNPRLSFFANTLATSIEKQEKSNLPIIHTTALNGISERILVNKVVIAGGALQSVKLFLNSPDIQSSANINSAGRFLMEHLDGYIGEISTSRNNRKLIDDIALDSNRKLVKRPELNCGVSMILGSLNEQKASYLNVGFEIVSRATNFVFGPKVNGSDSTSQGMFFKSLYLLERIIRKVFRVSTSLVVEKVFGVRRYSIWLKAEELPTEDSHVSIDTNTMKVNYSHIISEETSDLVREALIHFKSMVHNNNLGKVRYYDHVTDSSKILSLRPNWHPMGTLRMGMPGSSVVDKDLKVHGEDNIYVLSSAVFPTGSNQNPVFTTLALGTRLAENLSEEH